jgi:hypothetical protein
MSITPEEANRLRLLYGSLRATQALIGGTNDGRSRRQWVRHETDLFKAIRDIERRKEP